MSKHPEEQQSCDKQAPKLGGHDVVFPVGITRPTAEEVSRKPEPDYKVLWEQMCERCDELDKKLAQPEQELVCVCGAVWEGQELVSTPPQRKWVGLEEDEVEACFYHVDEAGIGLFDFAEAVEAKLKEKNT